MDSDTYRMIQSDLGLPAGKLGVLSGPRRLASIEEAMGFPSSDDVSAPYLTRLYGPFGDLEIAVAKPGKEAALSGDKLNSHDMTPLILNSGSDTGYRPSFGDIFRVLQTLGTHQLGPGVLEVLAALMFRSAFMLDHVEVQPGVWRYRPPAHALRYLSDNVDELDSFPPEAFLMLTEALALNEDVKYYARKGGLTDSGRQNNLLTCVHLAAVFLDRADLVRFSYTLIKGAGVAPISQKAARASFGLLAQAESDDLAALAAAMDGLRGVSVRAIAERGGIPMPKPGYKSTHRYVLERAARAALGDAAWDALVEAYNVKSVRVHDSLMPTEDMSFDTMSEETEHQQWAGSDLRATWVRPFVFLVFDDKPPADAVFRGLALAAIPLGDLDECVREMFEATVTLLRAGRRDGHALASEQPFFVRTHGPHRIENAAGENATPLSFWISKAYVQQMLLRSRGAGIEG